MTVELKPQPLLIVDYLIFTSISLLNMIAPLLLMSFALASEPEKRKDVSFFSVWLGSFVNSQIFGFYFGFVITIGPEITMLLFASSVSFLGAFFSQIYVFRVNGAREELTGSLVGDFVKRSKYFSLGAHIALSLTAFLGIRFKEYLYFVGVFFLSPIFQILKNAQSPTPTPFLM